MTRRQALLLEQPSAEVRCCCNVRCIDLEPVSPQLVNSQQTASVRAMRAKNL